MIKELLVGEPSTSLEGAGAIDVPALLDREYRLNMYSYTKVRQGGQALDRLDVATPSRQCSSACGLHCVQM